MVTLIQEVLIDNIFSLKNSHLRIQENNKKHTGLRKAPELLGRQR